MKDELIEEAGPDKPTHTPAPDNLYDNPLFDDEPVKVDLSLEKVGDTPEETATYEPNPADLEDDEKHAHVLNKYERF
jgi:hypothetical protein